MQSSPELSFYLFPVPACHWHSCWLKHSSELSLQPIFHEVPQLTKDEVDKALKGMESVKAAGDDSINVDLLKEGGDVGLQKLDALFSECLRTLKVPTDWKNANIILIHKKGHTQFLIAGSESRLPELPSPTHHVRRR